VQPGQIPHKALKYPLLKWVGSKHRFASTIIQHFPPHYKTYYEPFLGSGAVLGHLAPHKAIASDALKPLMGIWQKLKTDPMTLIQWYEERWRESVQSEKQAAYENIKARYNQGPNPADLLFLSRACYGGIVRFRKDGYMSTPCGVHDPILPSRFAERVQDWAARLAGTEFINGDFEAIMAQAQAGDLIYCDPPYSDTQAILYGAQAFSLPRLFHSIEQCKARGVYVVLSLDGSKKTGKKTLPLSLPRGLFEREMMIDCGRSMLRRFQMEGQTLETEQVQDRLLLTY
jgi:DNA adenine methylase